MSPLDTAIANEALQLAMEWGDQWLQPVQKRLSLKFPKLNRDDLDRYNEVAQSAMKFGHEVVYDRIDTFGRDCDELSTACRNVIAKHFPWVSDANLDRLFSQGMYYAWKNG